MKVIKIGAVWCPGCLVMGPRWQEIEAELPWLQAEYYDFDRNKEQMGRFNAVSDKLPVFIFIDKEDREIEADAIVMATGLECERALEEDIKKSGIPYHVIGCSKEPCQVPQAVHEGFNIGITL